MRPWRTGRKVGRTIYSQLGPEPSDEDVLIGVMDTADLARIAVETHNAVYRVFREAAMNEKPPNDHPLRFGLKPCGCVWLWCEDGCEPEQIVAALGMTMNETRCKDHQEATP